MDLRGNSIFPVVGFHRMSSTPFHDCCVVMCYVVVHAAAAAKLRLINGIGVRCFDARKAVTMLCGVRMFARCSM